MDTAPSKHSRAARRATSPGIDTDKSLKSARAPAESVNQRPAVLAAHHGGGIVKKTKRGGSGSGRKAVLITRARRRLERSAGRAEVVADRSAQKVRASVAQLGAIRSRKRTWGEINRDGSTGGVGKRMGSAARAGIASATVFELLGTEEEDMGEEAGGGDEVGEEEGVEGGTCEEGEGASDEEMAEAMGGDGHDAGGQRTSPPSKGPTQTPLPPDDEDEIL